MGTFAADVEELLTLGGVLHGLAEEAAALSVGPSADVPSNSFFSPLSIPTRGFSNSPSGTWSPPLATSSVLSSFVEASSISRELIDGALVSSLKERLGETGDIMVNVAEQFRNRDEQSATELATTYTNATGDWNAQDATA